ncbi:hypothetical protein RP300_02370 [Oligella urethralis]|uniref:polymorphic toxin type 15 domain-containing protein n=1 Tax=Oligella urethralis TaxID=90245 RepID=UPI0029587840|nr:polymorphic toxin type 15 domain-containing protein [Oligella urethralis]WOS38789.1 hypothetical protein RP300_02370 [Oligella urethralis]
MNQGNTKGSVTRQPVPSSNTPATANPQLSGETVEEKGFFGRAWDNMADSASWLSDKVADGAAWVVNNPWEATHLALDVAGMVPVIGEVADGTNALIYLARGDKTNAALSAAAMIPVVGSTATVGKMTDKAVRIVGKGRAKSPPGGKIRGPKRARMQPHRVKCFKPVNTPNARAAARKNINKDYPKGSKHKTEQQYLRDETESQLSNQEAALKNMTVKEYKEGRDFYKKHGRGSSVNHAELREKHRKEIAKKRGGEYEESGMNRNEAKALAKTESYEIMETLAVLHDPDQVLGGIHSKTEKLGLSNVNSSIGSSWNRKEKGQLSRVESLDEAVKHLPDDELLNIALEVCS